MRIFNNFKGNIKCYLLTVLCVAESPMDRRRRDELFWTAGKFSTNKMAVVIRFGENDVIFDIFSLSEHSTKFLTKI